MAPAVQSRIWERLRGFKFAASGKMATADAKTSCSQKKIKRYRAGFIASLLATPKRGTETTASTTKETKTFLYPYDATFGIQTCYEEQTNKERKKKLNKQTGRVNADDVILLLLLIIYFFPEVGGVRCSKDSIQFASALPACSECTRLHM